MRLYIRTMLITLIALLVTAAAALAQTPDYTLRIYAVGAPAPLTTATLLNASVSCNLAAPAGTATTRNPNKVVWDDPVNSGKVCVYTDAGTGPLLSTPTGFTSLEATVVMVSGGAETDESNRAPFTKTPAALKNVRLVR